MRNGGRLLAAVSVLTFGGMAQAQTKPGDVVIMRKSMTSVMGLGKPSTGTPTPSTPVPTPTPSAPTPTPTPASTPTPTPTPAQAEWTVGAWSWSGPAACTSSAPRSRTVSCMADGAVVPASRCIGTPPDSQGTAPRFDGCGFQWSAGNWSPYSSQCSATATRTRTLTCSRSDGASADVSQCDPATRPADSETSPVYDGCEHAWATGEYLDPGQSCTASETQTRSVTCRRVLDDATVADASCDPTSRPEATRQVADYSSCGYEAVNWTAPTSASTCSANTTRTSTAQCRRSDGTMVSAEECVSHGIAVTRTETGSDYSSCSSSWVPTSFVDPGASCTASETQTRDVVCRRDLDGATQPDAACDAATRPATTQQVADYSSCTYSAGGTSSISDWNSHCSASATRTTTKQCVRSDGTTVASTECTSRNVAVQSTETAAVYDQCSHSWATGAFVDPGQSCTSSETQTRSVTCQRDLDRAVVADGLCDATSKPSSTQQVEDYSACTYDWNAQPWSAPSTTCGQAQFTRTVSCRSLPDGRYVADSFCNAAQRPSATKTETVTSSCGYSATNWTTQSYGSTCSSNTTASQKAQCLRSDGTIVADAECTSRNVALTRTLSGQSNYSSCTYSAAYQSSSWSSSCSSSATNTTYYSCRRSDGATVSSSECTSRGISMQSSYTGQNYSGCTYTMYDYGTGACSNGQKPHYWACQRNQTGEYVYSGSYCGRENPTYEPC